MTAADPDRSHRSSSPSSPPDSPLTTKEEWRHFVAHDPSTLAGSKDEDQRREHHADLPMINTPTIRKGISAARFLLQLDRHRIYVRRGVIVSGASGTGKTTALTQLGRAH